MTLRAAILIFVNSSMIEHSTRARLCPYRCGECASHSTQIATAARRGRSVYCR
ncbi:hypothetical protein BDV41DRAFT_537306 [Aspergillus transmontanensis]|uniref:Uncharacterized protein n=1 Tax=Aspergillus transmontanensis TaxID=1034304 RepID=A0A5N6VY38_9EURO|nr:hypothetical protein BDV41DRAFT_537306 [Aspergillus transmontanensis]